IRYFFCYSCYGTSLSPISILLYSDPHSDCSTLSLHDALPISHRSDGEERPLRLDESELHSLSFAKKAAAFFRISRSMRSCSISRSEEHTSELQSREKLVCRLLLEKKNTNQEVTK